MRLILQKTEPSHVEDIVFPSTLRHIFVIYSERHREFLDFFGYDKLCSRKCSSSEHNTHVVDLKCSQVYIQSFFFILRKMLQNSCLSSHYMMKLSDRSILVREQIGFFCFPARVDKTAQIKAEPVPTTNKKKAQLSLQWPSL